MEYGTHVTLLYNGTNAHNVAWGTCAWKLSRTCTHLLYDELSCRRYSALQFSKYSSYIYCCIFEILL